MMVHAVIHAKIIAAFLYSEHCREQQHALVTTSSTSPLMLGPPTAL